MGVRQQQAGAIAANRADVVGIFRSETSILRLIGAVPLKANGEWKVQHRCMGVEARGKMPNSPPTNETLQLPPRHDRGF